MEPKLREIVFVIIELLAGTNYKELELLSGGVRLSADELKSVISEYGCRVLHPTLDMLELVDVIAIQSKRYPQWSVSVPLWTHEEGRSDLTLELTVIEKGSKMEVEIDNLHVL